MHRARLQAALLGLVMVGGWGAAHAADVQVRVVDSDSGQPLMGAAVCLGSGADPSQFGAGRADGDGRFAVRDVPVTALLLTVSAPGYRSFQRVLEPLAYDRQVSVPLVTGGGGPQCAAPAAAAAAPAELALADLRIDGGATHTGRRRVSLRFRASGQPTDYRVSERPDFAGAPWRPYHGRPVFELSAGVGTKTVYVQVRRAVGDGDAALQALSNVVSARIRLVAP